MKVLITFAVESTNRQDYPLAVVVVDDNGKHGQECLVRSLRDGRIFGNGVCSGLMKANVPNAPVNPELDPRLVEP